MLNTRRASLCVLASTVFVIASGLPASAATTIKVPLNQSIQAAVDSANPGDTVKLAKGVYNQRVTIGPGKDGLRLVASCDPKKRTTIDSLIGTTNFDAVTVESHNVLIKCITFRHADDSILAEHVNGTKVINIRSLNAKSDGVRFRNTDGVRVEGSYFAGSHSNAIDGRRINGGTIKGNTIKNNDSDCMTFRNVDDLVITENRSSICEDGPHLRINTRSNNNKITKNVMHTSDGPCVDLYNTTNHRIADNRCTNIEDYGVTVSTSTDTVVQQNAFRSIDIGCCNATVRGSNAKNLTVKANSFAAVYRAVDINGDNARVEGNNAVDVGYGAYRVSGKTPVVLNNTSANSGDDDGFNINCNGDCADGRVEGNSTQGTNSDDEGFYISVAWDQNDNSPNAGFRIIGNTSVGNNDEGFNIYASETVVQANTARGNGGDSYEDGFYISGGGNTITNNVSTDNVDDGFEIYGWNNTITGNRATGNLADGFYIVDTGAGPENHVLDANKAINNEGEGIENDAANTTLTNNVSKGNRLDCAGSQAPAVNTGNSCADGSNFTVDGFVD